MITRNGTFWCSGSLVNNTANDRRMLVKRPRQLPGGDLAGLPELTRAERMRWGSVIAFPMFAVLFSIVR